MRTIRKLAIAALTTIALIGLTGPVASAETLEQDPFARGNGRQGASDRSVFLEARDGFVPTGEGVSGDGCGESSDLQVQIEDCLLYTSPSPRDATLSRMPSSA